MSSSILEARQSPLYFLFLFGDSDRDANLQKIRNWKSGPDRLVFPSELTRREALLPLKPWRWTPRSVTAQQPYPEQPLPSPPGSVSLPRARSFIGRMAPAVRLLAPYRFKNLKGVRQQSLRSGARGGPREQRRAARRPHACLCGLRVAPSRRGRIQILLRQRPAASPRPLPSCAKRPATKRSSQAGTSSGDCFHRAQHEEAAAPWPRGYGSVLDCAQIYRSFLASGCLIACDGDHAARSVSVGALSTNGTLTLKYQAKTAVGTTIAWRLVLLHTHSAMWPPGAACLTCRRGRVWGVSTFK